MRKLLSGYHVQAVKPIFTHTHAHTHLGKTSVSITACFRSDGTHLTSWLFESLFAEVSVPEMCFDLHVYGQVMQSQVVSKACWTVSKDQRSNRNKGRNLENVEALRLKMERNILSLSRVSLMLFPIIQSNKSKHFHVNMIIICKYANKCYPNQFLPQAGGHFVNPHLYPKFQEFYPTLKVRNRCELFSLIYHQLK